MEQKEKLSEHLQTTYLWYLYDAPQSVFYKHVSALFDADGSEKNEKWA